MNIEQSCGGVAGSNDSPSVIDGAMVDSLVRLYPVLYINGTTNIVNGFQSEGTRATAAVRNNNNNREMMPVYYLDEHTRANSNDTHVLKNDLFVLALIIRLCLVLLFLLCINYVVRQYFPLPFENYVL